MLQNTYPCGQNLLEKGLVLVEKPGKPFHFHHKRPAQTFSSVIQIEADDYRWTDLKVYFIKPILVLDHFYRLYLVARILVLIDNGYRDKI